jgi:hypothetical protein
MKGIAWIVIVGLAASTSWAPPAQAEDAPPSWAYIVNPPDFKLEPDDGKLRGLVANSEVGHTKGRTDPRFRFC